MINKLIKEPLVHFIAAGIVLFILFGVVGSNDSEQEKVVQISKGQIDLMHSHWSRQLGRPPTEKELQGLIDDHIREEILMQEALAMGLDRDDIIIRRRLAQKMQFVSGEMLKAKEPTEDEISAYYEANKDDFREPGALSFLQLFFSVDQRDAAASERLAKEVKAELYRKSISETDLSQYGDRTMIRTSFEALPTDRLITEFGKSEIIDRLQNAAVGSWEGPVSSNYGLHLIYVLERKPGFLPEVEMVSEKIKKKMIDERVEELDQKFMAKLREQYTIEINDEVFENYNYQYKETL